MPVKVDDIWPNSPLHLQFTTTKPGTHLGEKAEHQGATAVYGGRYELELKESKQFESESRWFVRKLKERKECPI